MSWLTPRGVAAAVLVGAAVVAGMGLRGLALLGVFFATSSVLTPSDRRDPRESRGRTARQVLANGAVAAAAALAGWSAAAAGAIAAATADTWATEIGRRASTPPRLITTGRRVPAGTSGAVTALGTAGGVAGAVLLGALDATLAGRGIMGGGIVAGAGIAGMLADSLLGASVQARFRCPACGGILERRDAACHRRVVHAGGVQWLDNDAVNLGATLVGAAAALALSRWWG